MLLEAREGQGKLSVTKLVPGLPAELCGLIQIEDVLFKVQETTVSEWDLDDVCNLIKGKAHKWFVVMAILCFLFSVGP